MGCAISYFNDHIIDLSKRSNISKNSKALIVAPHNLYRFLSEDNPNPKCIFIFGKNIQFSTVFSFLNLFLIFFEKIVLLQAVLVRIKDNLFGK